MIYVLEDDCGILDLIVYALNNQDMKTLGFDNPSEFYKQLDSALPELIILDIMLPNENGLEILQKLRQNARTKDIIIICLSALSSEYDKIKGLDFGADDYITKPFSALELIARVKAHLRRKGQQKGNILAHKDLKLSKETCEVYANNVAVHLSLKEFKLLETLLENKDRVFSRDELLESIWGYNIQNTRTLDIHINTLRNKLGQYAKNIQTIRGFGYSFKSHD